VGVFTLDKQSAEVWAKYLPKGAKPVLPAARIPDTAPLSARPAVPPSRFDFEHFSRQIAEVIQAVLPVLAPGEAVLYVALFFETHGRGRPTCTLTQAQLAALTGQSEASILRTLRQLEARRVLQVTKSDPRRPRTYRPILSKEAETGLPWRAPGPVDCERFSQQFAEVIQAVLPMLDPGEAVLYLAIFLETHGRSCDTCTLTHAELATLTGKSRASIVRNLPRLIARHVLQVAGLSARKPRTYSTLLPEKGRTGLAWRPPKEWAFQPATPALEIDRLLPHHRAVVVQREESLDTREREDVHQAAHAMMRQAGWTAAEHASPDDTYRYRLEATFQRMIGLDRQEEFRESAGLI
jgi:CRP-like cAMP-binding protein